MTPACPEGVVCVAEFPYVGSANTAAAPFDRFDAYSCAPGKREAGPEVVYRLDVTSDAFLWLDVNEVGDRTDVDVHLLSALEPSACLRRADRRAGMFVTAGHYWVVVDTWGDGRGVEKAGQFNISIGSTPVNALVTTGMSRDAARHGLRAFDVALQHRDTTSWVYGILDFTLPSSAKRLWWVDLRTGAVRHHLYVAHGEGSSSLADPRFAATFSNRDGSHQSSLGMMRTAETYTGAFGESLRLDGLERGYNHLVRARAIVVHPWDGAGDEYVQRARQVAPTWGCPGLDPDVAADVIRDIQGGSLMFSWYPDGDWSTHSAYLR